MPRLVTESLPPVTGSPGLVQGAYGERGNLELAVPAADGGIWVFWFNADEVEHRAGAAQGCWSGGLLVFAGHQVDAARITQVQAGPHYLELLALSEHVLHRLYWTPERGFVDAGPIAPDIAAISPLREFPDELQIEVVGTDGVARLLVGDKLRYPFATWTAREPTAVSTRQEAPTGFPRLAYDALAWCETSLSGGRIDAVLRTGTELVHVHGGAGGWSEPAPIVSRVWIDADVTTVHRR